ncbi:hypothetical protein RGQ15_13600 [Paracoccus sp. MBLB3053]|uniref:DUF2163 domain-containing protein n=1 Tax=Paracoccus aurantius TaxID=3073814 RepID=A0ABU2HU72_9RHOB|nr:hypothetical protein [Paracoccus sp. MBLB3053]MDS9468599.1 hypothetical protein [Paracoccus sp. MBLB3053]
MRFYDSGFATALTAARDAGIAPVWFVWLAGRDFDTGEEIEGGIWSGQDDLTVNVPLPDRSGSQTRTYIGGCGLSVTGISLHADWSDKPVTVSLSQIADGAQYLMRGVDLRLAPCEIHATSLTGGALVSPPQLEFAGIIDEGGIATPAPASEGAITMAVRSELLTMYSATNPAKSSDAHQKRRAAGDRFCEYAGTVSGRKVQWYKGDD